MNKRIILILSLWFSSFAVFAQTNSKVVVVPLGGPEASLTQKRVVKNIPGGQFYPAFNNQNFFRNVGHYARFADNSPIAAIGLSSNIELPQGATLYSLSCSIDDQETAFDFGFSSGASIYRRGRNTTSEEDVTSIDLGLTTSGDNNGLTHYTLFSFAHPNIDNDNYFYTLYVFFQLATSAGGFVSTPVTASDIIFYGCTLTYDVDVVTVK